MEQRKRSSYKSCKYCNYCKYFESAPSSTGDGICNYTGTTPTEAKLNNLLSDIVVNFYDRGCVRGFEHTIHNHFGLSTPDYLKDYKNALKARVELAWDVYEHTHKPDPTIYTFI